LSTKNIESSLRKALLKNGPFSEKLFNYELKEHVDDFIESRKEDQNDYILSVTENSGDVAMVLVDDKNTLFVNNEARAQLQIIWKDKVYSKNIIKLVPSIADSLNNGLLFHCGFTTTERAKLHRRNGKRSTSL
jgi:hypothetical protein